MGEVIPFQTRGGKSRAGVDSAPTSGEAQILFFLGVRYERLEDARPEKAVSPGAGHGPRGGRKRKSRARAV